MKWKEIKESFDGEWVLIECFKVDSETFEILDGKVLYHSPDVGKIYTKLLELRPEEYAIEYIGEVPEEFGVAL